MKLNHFTGSNITKPGIFFLLLLSAVLIGNGADFGVQAGTVPPQTAATKSDRKVAESWRNETLELLSSDLEKTQEVARKTLTEADTRGNKMLKMYAFYVLGRVYIEKNEYLAALAALDSALVIAGQFEDLSPKAEILYRQGLTNHYMGESVKALGLLNDAVQALRFTTQYITLASSYSVMGTIYRMNGLYDRAIEYILKAELNYQKADFEEGYAWSAYLLGRTYSDLGLNKEALRYYEKALETYKKTAAADGKQNGIAICNEQIASVYIKEENYADARTLLEQNKTIYNEIGSTYGMSNVYKSLGILEYSIGNNSEAERNFRTSLKMKDVNNDLGIPIILTYLGVILAEQGHTDQGIAEIQRGLAFAKENNQKRIQLDIYKKLAEVYQKNGNLEAAIECQMQQIHIQDIILAGGGNIKASQLAAIYEIDQKNAQIAELEKQNKINELNIKQQQTTRNIMIGGIVLALLLAGNFYWFYLRLRRSNRKLNDINAAKDKFFSIISHDLRGPTGSLSALLKYVDSNFDKFQPNELQELISTLTKSAEQVSDLLENLLIWARSQTGRMAFRPQRLNLAKSLEQAVNGVSAMAHTKEITINTKTTEEIFVTADSNMLQTILRNLLSNAIKFTPRGGKVELSYTQQKASQVHLSISDSGVGIDRSKISRLFNISNADNTPGTENESSSGLGLILVKDFVEKNNGTIAINSEVNKGTTVTVSLMKA